jgi:hypothetical protein
MKRVKYIGIIVVLFALCSCSKAPKEPVIPEVPLNITVLLDLSDRITKKDNNVEQQKKDIELIMHLEQGLKNKVVSSRFVCKDKFQILLYPDPELDSIAEIAKSLRLDMSSKTSKERDLLKEKVRSLDSLFSTNLNIIYNKTKVSNNYRGSDIWGFFQNKVQDYCIRDGYRNILVILTDGYIYHKDNKIKKNGKPNWILSSSLQKNPNIKLANPFDSNNALINLEVMMLELNPNPDKQEKVLKNVLSQWLDEMGVSAEKRKLLTTDQPSIIMPLIDDFIFNK